MSSTSPVIFQRDPAMEAPTAASGAALSSQSLGNDLSGMVIEGCTFDHEGLPSTPATSWWRERGARGISDRLQPLGQPLHQPRRAGRDSLNLQWARAPAWPASSSGATSFRLAALWDENPTTYAPFAVHVTAGEHVLVQGRTRNHYGV